jgi:hypothetical protein
VFCWTQLRATLGDPPYIRVLKNTDAGHVKHSLRGEMGCGRTFPQWHSVLPFAIAGDVQPQPTPPLKTGLSTF